jgi:group I intron endonuclease
MAYIYKTTNLINGKIYIGQTKRKTSKYLGSGTFIKQAILEYGKHNFNREIIEEVDASMIDEREKYWISHFNSTNPKIGYNRTMGGSGFNAFGVKRSEDTKIRISKSKTGIKLSESHKKSISESNKGKHSWNSGKKTGMTLSEDHKEKLHSSRRGKPSWNSGATGCYIRTEETRKKISEFHKGKPKSDEHREKIRTSLTGKKTLSLYDKWMNKYGEEEANRKMEEYKDKQRNAKKRKEK